MYRCGFNPAGFIASVSAHTHSRTVKIATN